MSGCDEVRCKGFGGGSSEVDSLLARAMAVEEREDVSPSLSSGGACMNFEKAGCAGTLKALSRVVVLSFAFGVLLVDWRDRERDRVVSRDVERPRSDPLWKGFSSEKLSPFAFLTFAFGDYIELVVDNELFIVRNNMMACDIFFPFNSLVRTFVLGA